LIVVTTIWRVPVDAAIDSADWKAALAFREGVG
jgi:hypothetical protein